MTIVSVSSPLMKTTIRYSFLISVILFTTVLFSLFHHPVWGASYFEDGYLGLTQEEVHHKLGLPHKVRSRKAALRVFHYYSFADWKKYFQKLVAPENGEDVYVYQREKTQVRYSFVYTPDLRGNTEFPPLYVKRVEVEFTPSVSLENIPLLVHEFVPPSEPDAPAFRSNLWILLFYGSPSKEAQLIVKERDKEKWEWSLAYQMFSLKGLPNIVTPQSSIDRLEFTTQSLSLVQTNQRLTHEPMLNPYSRQFLQRPTTPRQSTQSIPMPEYEN